MSELAIAPARAPEQPTVIADRLDVTYRVYADSQPKLRKLFVGEKQQRQYQEVEAVRGVSFVTEPGEAVGIIGHNGSGKSTLLRAIAGLVPSTGGQVYASSIPVLLGVAAALEPDISGRRNIYLGGTALGIPREELDERFDDIVSFAGLEEFIDLPLRAFSTGMRSRLQFAIATARTPEILMVDEALSTGDGEFKDRSDARIREMIAEAGTVFLVSHTLKAVTDVCNRVLWLDHGQLVADGPPERVVAAYQEHVDRLRAADRKRRRRKAAGTGDAEATELGD
ncbi:MAG: ABC transporter ATP-binding protein [Nitriliruptoraceae bacterium]